MRRLLIVIVLFIGCSGWAQLSLTASLDTAVIEVGQQCSLKLEVHGADDENAIRWPDFRAALPEGVDLIETGNVKALSEAKQGYARMLQITSWDSGYYAIEPITIDYLGEEVQSEAMLLSVNNVRVNLAQAPKGIKDIYQEPFDLWEWLQYNWLLVLLCVLGLALMGLVIWLIRFRKRSPSIVQKTPEIPLLPHELALKRLEALKGTSAISQTEKKAYYSSLSDTLREYLEGRYHIHAMEQTSQETLESVRYLGLDQQWQDHFRSLLCTADMVKFAKEDSSNSIAEQHLDLSREFVLATLPIIESEEDE